VARAANIRSLVLVALVALGSAALAMRRTPESAGSGGRSASLIALFIDRRSMKDGRQLGVRRQQVPAIEIGAIVDDDRDVRDAIAGFLPTSYQCLQARTGSRRSRS
jgi:hypothetical protein